MNWSDGYVSEVDYTFGYHRELSPRLARFSLLSRGVQSVDLEHPTYLELGFGQGLPLAIHAAANPGEYWGTDLNPAHAAGARTLAAASGAPAQLLDDSFAELAARPDLPDFDMIALHGVWSWINDANRRAIIDLARKKLKPGGVFYVSYNTMPGWSPMLPLRHLLALHAQRSGGEAQGLLSKIDDALEFAGKVSAAGSLYFASNPAAVERLDKLRKRSKKYVAHEYFNADWEPMPFSRVAALLDGAKLSFAAEADPLEQIDGLHFGPEARALLNSLPDLVLRESVRDFLVNQPFRRDYFVRGPRRLAALDQQEQLRAMRFVLGRQPEAVQLEVKGALGVAKLQESIYLPIIESLAARPKTLGELAAEATTQQIAFSELLQAISVLAGKGEIHPAHDDETRELVAPRTKALNRQILQRARAGREIDHLASPVTGGGIGVTRTEQLLLLAREQGHSAPESWAEHAWAVLSEQGHRMLKAGKRLETAEENLTELTRQARDLADHRLSLFERLGLP